MLNEDYKEMLQLLLGNKVKFLVVGAYAMGAYGCPRATGDFDIWVEASAKNAKRVYKSLAEFGAPLAEVTEQTFSERGYPIRSSKPYMLGCFGFDPRMCLTIVL